VGPGEGGKQAGDLFKLYIFYSQLTSARIPHSASQNPFNFFFLPKPPSILCFRGWRWGAGENIFGGKRKRPIFAAAFGGNSSLNGWHCDTNVNKIASKNLLGSLLVVSLPSALKSGSSSNQFWQGNVKKSK